MRKTDEKTWEKILSGIASGLSNKDAIINAGINQDTFYEKVKKDTEYAEKVQKALIQFKFTHVQKIATNGSWQASAWLLERKFANEYSARTHIDHTTKGKEINQIKVSIVTAPIENGNGNGHEKKSPK